MSPGTAAALFGQRQTSHALDKARAISSSDHVNIEDQRFFHDEPKVYQTTTEGSAEKGALGGSDFSISAKDATGRGM